MDMNKINEQLLIERYLQGTLSDEEEKAFEEAIVSSPGLLDQLEATERLREGLKDLHAVGGFETQGSRGFAAARGTGSPALAAVTGLFHSPRYALAATVLLAVSLVMTASLYNRGAGQAMLTPGGDTQIAALHTVRSVNGDEPFNILEQGNPGSWQVLMVDPGYEVYTHFRATLSRLENGRPAQAILELDNMQPGYEDQLALGLPSDLLSPGDYEVQVDGWRSEWPADHDYEPVNRVTFRVH